MDKNEAEENSEKEGFNVPRKLSENVLFNSVIFEVIWKHIGTQDRKALRLVCRYWNMMSKHWVASIKIRLCSWDCTDPRCEVPSPQKFLEFLTSCTTDHMMVHFKHYILEGWDLIYPLLSKNKEKRIVQAVQLQFWEQCKYSMESLHLRKCVISQERLVHVIEDLAPNLRCLVLTGNNINPLEFADKVRIHPCMNRLEFYGPVPFTSWHFLDMFPNLKHLKLSKFSMGGFFLDLQDVREDHNYNILRLTNLDLMDTEQCLNGFIGAHLPLKHFTFRALSVIDKDALKEIMTFCDNSLESLKLFRFPISSCPPFPTFPFEVTLWQVTILELWGNMVDNLNFLDFMPALKKLRVDVICFEKREVIQYFCGSRPNLQLSIGDIMENSSLPTKKFKLEEYITDLQISLEGWKRLSCLIPKLKVLQAPLNDTTLRFVCSDWKNLRKLKCRFGSDITDKSITELEGEGAFNLLKDLNEFELEAECGKAKLTDLSAQNAFLRMDSLESLKIYVSREFTQDMKCLLKEKIGKVKIICHDLENHQLPDVNHLIGNEELQCCKWEDYRKLWTPTPRP